jgi:hypothetical protein
MPSKKQIPKDTDEKPLNPEGAPAAPAEGDVEGHVMLYDHNSAREMARIREREIQRRAERHGQEEEARRPYKPKKK